MGSEVRESDGLPGLPAAEAPPPFTVTVDPNFREPLPSAEPARLPTLIGWHEVHIVWAESGEHVATLEHIPTGRVVISPPFSTDDERHAALVALDAEVNLTHEREHGGWVRSDG
jgi:hypothetical protein